MIAQTQFPFLRDPTQGRIDKRIVQRMTTIAHNYTELTVAEKREFDAILLRTALKLVAVWNHLDRYRILEDELIAAAKKRGPIDETGIKMLEYSQDLFIEIDEFLVQVKSALDHLVHITAPILGKTWKGETWKFWTFHEKGQQVSKALSNNVPKSHRPRALSIKKELDRHEPWLTGIINMRDRFNHLKEGGFDIDRLKVYRQAVNGETKLQVPMWDEALTVRRVLETSWISLLQFTEDFIALFLSFRIVPELGMIHEIVDHQSNESPWQVATSEEVERKRNEPAHRLIVSPVVLFAPSGRLQTKGDLQETLSGRGVVANNAKLSKP